MGWHMMHPIFWIFCIYIVANELLNWRMLNQMQFNYGVQSLWFFCNFTNWTLLNGFHSILTSLYISFEMCGSSIMATSCIDSLMIIRSFVSTSCFLYSKRMNSKIHKIRKKIKRIGKDKLHKTKDPQPSFYVNN